MKPLPPALLNPQDGRYSVEDGVRVWMHAYHGIEYDAPTDSRAYRLARRSANNELAPIVHHGLLDKNTGEVQSITRAEWSERYVESLDIFRQPSGLAPDNDERPRRPRPKKTATRRWIDQADLIELARAHGVGLGTDETRPVQESIPTAKPGPKPKNDEAVDYALDLIADGMQQNQAAMEAAEKFDANKDSIERTIRRRRQRQ